MHFDDSDKSLKNHPLQQNDQNLNIYKKKKEEQKKKKEERKELKNENTSVSKIF